MTSAHQLLGKCHMFSGFVSRKEIDFCMTFWVSQQIADIC